MRVEGETRSGAVVDPPDDIGAAVCKRANLRGEADGLEFGREEGGGLDLPSRWVLRVDRDEPLEEAREASDIGRIQVLDKQLRYSFETAGAPRSFSARLVAARQWKHSQNQAAENDAAPAFRRVHDRDQRRHCHQQHRSGDRAKIRPLAAKD